MPYHVVNRGNNKSAIFLSEHDYRFFLDVLAEAKSKHHCDIYSYCLMPNHFHLLVQPKEKESISLLMKLLGGKYVRHFNTIHQRSGTLWEGRFRCSLIDTERYFLSCLRYIEMNPLRANLTNAPDLYRWSSFRFRAFGEKCYFLDSDPWYQGLAENCKERQRVYRQFFKEYIPTSELDFIREMTNVNGIIGSESFKKKIEEITGAPIVFRKPGRPKIDPTPFLKK
jgi:putative transposase